MRHFFKTLMGMVIAGLLITSAGSAERFSFVALGDTAYGGPADYPTYNALIDTINTSRPAFTIHIGDVWGGGGCADDHYLVIKDFFNRYDHPLVYTPGDNEWTDCDRRTFGGYVETERLDRLRKVFFPNTKSLGKKPMTLVRQSDISSWKSFQENVRWAHKDVLFLTLHITGSSNNFDFESRENLLEAWERNQANVAWLRDSFRIAREHDMSAVVVAFHAEILMNGQIPLDSYLGPKNGPFGTVVKELLVAGQRFAKPVLLIHGDTHKYTTDKPFGEDNISRLEVFGNPDIKSVQVDVDTKTPSVFSFSPLYNAE